MMGPMGLGISAGHGLLEIQVVTDWYQSLGYPWV